MRVLTVGGAMIDTIAIIASERIEQVSMRNAESTYLLLEEGGKTEAQEISIHCGGGAANAAVAMSRLGLDVATFAKLGMDERAETLLGRLTAEGVSTRWVVRDHRAPTGASILISSHDRNAAVFTFRGANTLVEVGDFHDDAFAVDVVYISNLSNKSAECFPFIVSKAKENGAIVAVNPGGRQLSAYGSVFHDCLKSIDILSINRSEAGFLVSVLAAGASDRDLAFQFPAGKDGLPVALRGFQMGESEMNLAAFFRVLTAMGPRYVVMTDGSRGAFVATPDEILYCPAISCPVVGTAGAGDAFASTFTAYVALGRSAEDALRAATLNAASVVGYADTQMGLLRRQELEEPLSAATDTLRVYRLWGAATGSSHAAAA